MVLSPPGPLGLLLVNDLLDDVLAGRVGPEAGPAQHVVPAAQCGEESKERRCYL